MQLAADTPNLSAPERPGRYATFSDFPPITRVLDVEKGCIAMGAGTQQNLDVLELYLPGKQDQGTSASLPVKSDLAQDALSQQASPPARQITSPLPEDSTSLLRTQSVCHEILTLETAAIFKAHPRYRNLSASEQLAHLTRANELLGDFLGNAHEIVKAEASRQRIPLPPISNQDIEQLFYLVSGEVWKTFRHPPSFSPSNIAPEVPAKGTELRATVGFLFEVLDAENPDMRFLDCKTSAYLTAELLQSLGAHVRLVSTREHALVYCEAEDSRSLRGGVYLETTAAGISSQEIRCGVMEEEQYLDANPHFIDLSHFTSDNFCVRLARGNLFYEAGWLNEALEEYKRAQEPDQRETNAWYNTALVYKGLGRHEEFALACLRYQISGSPWTQGSTLLDTGYYPHIKEHPDWQKIMRWEIPDEYLRGD